MYVNVVYVFVCVVGRNSYDNIGFLHDFRRLNVAVTRAKYIYVYKYTNIYVYIHIIYGI